VRASSRAALWRLVAGELGPHRATRLGLLVRTERSPVGLAALVVRWCSRHLISGNWPGYHISGPLAVQDT
jgi:hypothetical protein